MNVPGIYKPSSIIQDKRLTPIEQDYLCLVAYLEKRESCTASNQFFADYFGVSRPRAVEVLTNLKTKGFIMSVDKKQGGKVIQRTITIIDVDSRKSLLLNGGSSPMSISRNQNQLLSGDKIRGREKLPRIHGREITSRIKPHHVVNI